MVACCDAGILYAIYHFGLFSKYKIQAQNKWPARQLVIDCVIKLLVNHLILQPFAFYFLFGLFKRFGMPAVRQKWHATP